MGRDSLEQKVLKIAESYLSEPSHFIVDIVISKGGKKKVAIYVDGDKGIRIEDCSKLSRNIASHFETEDIIDGAYVLEVSSPGLDQPLKLNRQYVKNVGRQVSLRLNDESELEGKLTEVSEEKISLEVKQGKKEVKKEEVLLQDIKQTKLIITI